MDRNDKTSARSAAFSSVKAIEKHSRYANIEIDSTLRSGTIENRSDRNLYTRLVYGVIEKKITLDYVIGRYSDRDIASLDDDTLILLRMGIYQLMYNDKLPDYAVINETVGLAPRRSRGFVNAVLRSFIRNGRQDHLKELEGPYDHRMSVMYSVSEKICGIIRASYGTDKTEDILRAVNRDPGIDLRVNTLKCSTDEAIHTIRDTCGIPVSEGRYLPYILNVPYLTGEISDGIRKGLWFIQDEASALCTEAAVQGLDSGSPVIADVCSAPGGKSFSVSILTGCKGGIHSFDLHSNKLSLIGRQRDNLGITNMQISQRDAREPDPELIGKCDLVIADVPCSGLGVMGKKPEIRYKSADDIEKLPAIQYSILESAAGYVKPGGALVYSTCTINKEENENNYLRFLREHPGFSPCGFSTEYEGRAPFASDEGFRTLFPDTDLTDGFFISKMRKEK